MQTIFVLTEPGKPEKEVIGGREDRRQSGCQSASPPSAYNSGTRDNRAGRLAEFRSLVCWFIVVLRSVGGGNAPSL
ncbi:hypothetical protein BaRGS_00020617, partial [Batillaria attramentaria]